MNCIFLRRGYGSSGSGGGGGGNTAPEIYSTFADNEWSTIIYACQNNLVPSSWAVGNQKPMTIDGTTYNIDIIGKNHDEYSDGSGKAPLTLQLHELYKTQYATATTAATWKDCSMRNTTLPSILSKMPSEVQAAVKEVNKKGRTSTSGNAVQTTADKLFLLAGAEVFASVNSDYANEGTQYAYYAADANNRYKLRYGTTYKGAWGLRTIMTGTNSYGFVNTSTSSNYMESNAGSATDMRHSFAFCF